MVLSIREVELSILSLPTLASNGTSPFPTALFFLQISRAQEIILQFPCSSEQWETTEACLSGKAAICHHESIHLLMLLPQDRAFGVWGALAISLGSTSALVFPLHPATCILVQTDIYKGVSQHAFFCVAASFTILLFSPAGEILGGGRLPMLTNLVYPEFTPCCPTELSVVMGIFTVVATAMCHW